MAGDGGDGGRGRRSSPERARGSRIRPDLRGSGGGTTTGDEAAAEERPSRGGGHAELAALESLSLDGMLLPLLALRWFSPKRKG